MPLELYSATVYRSPSQRRGAGNSRPKTGYAPLTVPRSLDTFSPTAMEFVLVETEAMAVAIAFAKLLSTKRTLPPEDYLIRVGY